MVTTPLPVSGAGLSTVIQLALSRACQTQLALGAVTWIVRTPPWKVKFTIAGLKLKPFGAHSPLMAAPRLIRRLVMLLPPSVTATPVVCSIISRSVTLASGAFSLSTANAPATCGAAIEVPLLLLNRLPGTDELIQRPGASSFRNEAL